MVTVWLFEVDTPQACIGFSAGIASCLGPLGTGGSGVGNCNCLAGVSVLQGSSCVGLRQRRSKKGREGDQEVCEPW